MYSYEDRIRAVKLYIKLGKRLGATLRQLGYPTKNSLIGWCREYEQRRDLQAGYARSMCKYSDEQRQVAVQHYLDHDRCVAVTMKALGYPCRETLTAWIDELHPELRHRMVGRAPHVQHPLELKNAAVIELCTRTTSAQEIAEKVAVCRPTLYNWKNQLLGREAPASMKPPKNSDSVPDKTQLTDLQQQVDSLQRNIRRLQLEHDLLKKANELLKKGLGVAPQLLSNREKTLLVDALKHAYALSELFAELDLARSSYFYHCARLKSPDKYAHARIAITDVFQSNHRCYGYRRLRAALGRRQLHISEKVVQRLMKQECLVVTANKKRRYGSYLGEISPAPENLINRDFQADSPNEKWLTDITEFQIPAGKVYLSPIVDCFDGLVVSWTIGTRPDAELVNTMLDAAIETVASSPSRPVIHSDRGAHYRWPGWLSRVQNAKLIRSMSRKGCSPDNAACEGFFGRLKTELFYPRNWQDITIDHWGRSDLASSDMMSMETTKRVWQARLDPRRNTPSIGIYSHVRDRWGISYAQPFVLNERQAGVAIEGVLRQERMETSQLAVDTHGYTDFAMTLARLLGFDLCPRLKELKQRHLFLPKGMVVPAEIASVCEANVNTDLIEKHWDTLVHLAASVMSGNASAVAALARFGSAARGEAVYEAGVQLGKLLRTAFLADYFVKTPFRQELRRVLNRGEAVNAMKRVFYIGRISPAQAKRPEEMQAVADGLSLLANIVLAWNTMQMQAVVNLWANRRQVIEADIMAKIAPTRLSGINLRGVFRFPVERFAADLMPSTAPAIHAAVG